MTRDLRDDLHLSLGRHPPAAGQPTQDRGAGHDGDVGLLGQAISQRLFSAGLDLDYALSLDGDGPAAGRLRHAVAELDEAIKTLRHLVLAVPGPMATQAASHGNEGSAPR